MYSSEIARKFPSDHELHIVTPVSTSEIAKQLDRMMPSNVFIHQLRGSAESLFQDALFKGSVAVNLIRLAKATGCEVISSSSRMPDLLCKPERLPIPVVTTVHSTVENHVRALKSCASAGDILSRHERKTLAAQRFIIAGEDRYYRSHRHFISVSKWGMENLKLSKRVDASRISLVYNGVDTEKFTPKKKADSQSGFTALREVDALKVLFVGRYTLGKGYHVLKEAIKNLETKDDVHFVLAGDQKAALLNDVRLKGTTTVGHVPHSDMPHLYSSCDVLILPSLYENMPLSLLEAMSSGCAPIASDVGGVSEVVQDGVNGRLVEHGNMTAIVDAIRELADDPGKLRRMQSAGRNLMERRHSLDAMIAHTLAVFDRVSHTGTVHGAESNGPGEVG